MAERVVERQPVSGEFERPADRDLGFGAVVTETAGPRFLNRDGTFNVGRDGFGILSSLNAYHSLLTMRWKTFLGLVLLLYFVSNVVFGSIYASFGDAGLVDTTGSTDGLFLRGFFFSVQTFATIGYGTIHPLGIVPNLLVTIESYYSLIANALITGLVFARFARPTARIVFSDVAVIAPYQDITGLMFRLVNGRSSQLLEVKAQVIYARFVDETGRRIRKFDLLPLERRSVSFFPLTWTVVHPIDEGSPLFGCTMDDLKAADAEFLILLTATDETFASIVHQRSSYKPDEVRFGHKFVSIYNNEPGEKVSIDARRLSRTEKAEIRAETRL
jgi:inward rectifier potassium channel